MSLSIGSITSTAAALRSAPELGRARLHGEGAVQPNAPGRNEERLQPRVGFGEGTLSPQGAALRTIDRTVHEVRRRQPSLDDIRGQFQARAAQRRAARTESTNDTDSPPAARTAEREPSGVSARIRRFAATNSDAAQPARATRADRSPPSDRPKATATARARAPRPDAGDSVAERNDRPRIDVRV